MPKARQLAILMIFLPFAAHALNSEDYAIYSVVVNGLSISHSANPRFAIVRDTVDPRSLEAQSRRCAELRDFQFPWRTTKPERLDGEKLVISRPYRGITEEEGGQWIRRRFSPLVPTDPPGPEPPDPYPGLTDLIRLSNITYSSDHARAAVYVSDTCGSLCGVFGWFIVEKSPSGGWRMLSNPGCESIA